MSRPPRLSQEIVQIIEAAHTEDACIALQRVLLTITDAGLAASMLSQPVENQAGRDNLRLASGRSDVPQMVLRVGSGRAGYPTPRRDLAEVIDEA